MISAAVDDKKTVALISLDVSKAFDTIDHSIMIEKLKELNIGINAIKLIDNYLKDRIQYVKVGDILSESGVIRRGIPQGTNLGPLMFSIYISDMQFLQTHARIMKFADDTLLFYEFDVKSQNPSEMIREDLKILYEYYENVKLSINYAKSQCLLIGDFISDGMTQILAEHGINRVNELKYLGVTICHDRRGTEVHNACRRNQNEAESGNWSCQCAKEETASSSSIDILLCTIQKSTITIRKNDTEIVGPSIFNSLPKPIRDIQSKSSFQRRLKDFLLSKNSSLCSKQQISSRKKII